MKTLQKLSISVILLGLSFGVMAQSFAVRGGLNIADMLIEDDFEDYAKEMRMLYGFHAGATLEMPFTDFFAVETGVLFSRKGIREVEEDGDDKYKSIASLYYMDIPITGKFFHEFESTRVYGFAGPYVGIGLKGKFKETATFDDASATVTEDVNWGTDADDDFKRLDLGMTAGAGIEYHSVFLEVNYWLGLYNTSAYTEDGFKSKNRVIGVTAGYRFGK